MIVDEFLKIRQQFVTRFLQLGVKDLEYLGAERRQGMREIRIGTGKSVGMSDRFFAGIGRVQAFNDTQQISCFTLVKRRQRHGVCDALPGIL